MATDFSNKGPFWSEADPKFFQTIDCISMWQPWAMWTALGWKTAETRRHNRLACLAQRKRRIAIHAANKWDPDWKEKARPFLTNDQLDETVSAQLYDIWPRKAIICTVFPDEHRRLVWSDSNQALCECGYNDLFGLILEDIELFDPIPWKGHQGIMKVPEEVIRNALSS